VPLHRRLRQLGFASASGRRTRGAEAADRRRAPTWCLGMDDCGHVAARSAATTRGGRCAPRAAGSGGC
jgi:hypothetical protein